MANSDAMGSVFNYQFKRLQVMYPKKIKLVSSLGRLNYFKSMQQCKLMLGNTSSGIIEAASFNKYVINVGNRQKGRLKNNNVMDVQYNYDQIRTALGENNDEKPY